MDRKSLRTIATKLRMKGKTYSEICTLLGQTIPQSTLSYWFRGVQLSHRAIQRREKTVQIMLHKARYAALKTKRNMQVAYLESVQTRNLHLGKLVPNRDIAKIILAMLYLGEGAKNSRRASVMLGSADPRIILTFLSLMRYCYPIIESKFRCTVQCRADHDTKQLERFWQQTTQIPHAQFYRTRIDPRTIGIPSKKLDYKGVCRIEYLSADVFHDFLAIAEIVVTGARSLEEKR